MEPPFPSSDGPLPVLNSRTDLSSPSSQDGVDKKVWEKVTSSFKLVREQSQAGLASLQESASITATGRRTAPTSNRSIGLDDQLDPPPRTNQPPPRAGALPGTPVPEVDLEGEPVDASERCRHAGITVLACVCGLGIIAAWVIWFVIPMLWIFVGRHEVKRTWTESNCTVLAQSCYKKCTGCGCPDSCCTSALDCTRSSYHMSQNCVWLSMSKFVQDKETFEARVEVNDLLSDGLRRAPASLFVTAVVTLGSGVFFGFLPSSKRLLFICLLFLLLSLASANGCSCWQWHRIAMTVETQGPEPIRVTKEYNCASEGDDRRFCQEYFGYRDKSCRTLEDLETKPYCKETYLNNIGKGVTCYINPDDPSDVEIQGSKGHGTKNLAALIVWGIFTFIGLLFARDHFKSRQRDRELHRSRQRDRELSYREDH